MSVVLEVGSRPFSARYKIAASGGCAHYANAVHGGFEAAGVILLGNLSLNRPARRSFLVSQHTHNAGHW